MADNLMNKDHKATNAAYREGYERIFGNGVIPWWVGTTIKCQECGFEYQLSRKDIGEVCLFPPWYHIPCELCGKQILFNKEGNYIPRPYPPQPQGKRIPSRTKNR